jgi:UDP-glucose 4-epimerase
VAEILYRSAFIDHESFMAINVGTGDEHSAQDIVEMIGELLDRAIHIDIDSARIRLVDKQHQMADTRKLRLKTGLQAKHSLRKGLQKLLVHENFKLNKTNTGE